MGTIKSLTIIGLLLTFVFGQLTRLNFFNLSFPLIDIFIIFFTGLNLIDHYLNHSLVPRNRPFLYFIIFSFFSLIINLILFNYPPLKPLLYFFRLSSLLLLFIFPPRINHIKINTTKIITLCILSNIIFGLIQYFIWPDFTYFDSLNWDPHLSRLVSTFFDPTFTGLIYLMFLIYSFNNHHLLLAIPTYLALALTYSRSTYLSLIVAAFYISHKLNKPKIFFIGLLLVAITVIMLPRPPGEGTKLERTSSIIAKIENYREGFRLFLSSPIIGHGYNNLGYSRNIKNPLSHSNFGFDSSLLTILTSTGIIGFTLFCLGLFTLFRQSSLVGKTTLIAIITHSLFANSLLYPWILVFLLFI